MNVLTENFKLYNGDCLEIMDKLIGMGVKVDAVICDPPYGTTTCKWDSIIPLEEMWKRLNKLIKPNGVVVLFGDEPFTSTLVCSNIKNFKYKWTWNKVVPSGHLNAKKMPLKQTEDICVFYKKAPIYNPQIVYRNEEEIELIKSKGNKKYKISDEVNENTTYGKMNILNVKERESEIGKKYPTNLIEFNKRRKECNTRNRVHPTQKPVDLLEYLVKSYTNEGELVLDFTMGSGSTGVACLNTNRKFIGIELDSNYFDIAIKRTFEDYGSK